MHQRYFEFFCYKHGLKNKVVLILAGTNEGAMEDLNARETEGLTRLNEDGRIEIVINERTANRCTILEELAHALQIVSEGDREISFSRNYTLMKEYEIAKCFSERRQRRHLTQAQLDRYTRSIESMERS